MTIPRGQLTVITGVSGSGKSSLAFDTLHAEGSRQYLESLSAKARGMLDAAPRPDVDFIRGLSPVIAIAQRTGGNTNPRSTVATLTEIADHARPSGSSPATAAASRTATRSAAVRSTTTSAASKASRTARA